MSDLNTITSQLWAMANELRGNMDASEYRNYILGFMFYRYLSERQENHLFKNKILMNNTYLGLYNKWHESFMFSAYGSSDPVAKPYYEELKNGVLILENRLENYKKGGILPYIYKDYDAYQEYMKDHYIAWNPFKEDDPNITFDEFKQGKRNTKKS